MQHYDIWRAIDALAAENGLSASGLARKAGLDPTAFNPSKRTGPDGRARWPSTESVAKVLEATGTSLDAFASLVSGTPMNFRSAAVRPVRRIPLIGLAQAGSAGYFDDGGFPSGAGWDEISVPEIPDPNAYAPRSGAATVWWSAPGAGRSWPRNSSGNPPGRSNWPA